MKNRIRELRIEKGLRQKDVAEKIGVSAQSFGYYENWINKPDPETLIKLADLFEVSIDYLLGRENDDGTILRGAAENGFTDDELRLIREYRALSEPMKTIAQKTLSAWKDVDCPK